MSIHVYSAPTQPATYYRVDLDGRELWLSNSKNRAFWASCCKRRRCARNLAVQAYYDQHRFTRVDGKGCRGKQR